MHCLMILLALSIALTVRFLEYQPSSITLKDGEKILFLFLFPPLLLLMTAIAVLSMGYQGEMFGLQASHWSYIIALFVIIVALVFFGKAVYTGIVSCQNLTHYPLKKVEGKKARILETSFPYTAQIGFWQPQLVISKGLIELLDKDHLKVVLAHEQAHYQFRDTFFFFWLGWLKSFTLWLPHSESLWQDLLLLREMRADRQAAQEYDPLLLAESLLIVAQKTSKNFPINSAENMCASLSCSLPRNRLSQRIDALLAEEKEDIIFHWWDWNWLIFVCLPLMVIPWHS